MAIAVAYVILIQREEGSIGWDGLAVFALIAVPGVLGLVASRSADPDRALILRAAGAGTLVTMGILGIFSIGLPLLVAGGGLAVAAVRRAGAASSRAKGRAVLCAGAAALVPLPLLF